MRTFPVHLYVICLCIFISNTIRHGSVAAAAATTTKSTTTTTAMTLGMCTSLSSQFSDLAQQFSDADWQVDGAEKLFCAETAPSHVRCECSYSERCANFTVASINYGQCKCCASWVWGITIFGIIVGVFLLCVLTYGFVCRNRWWCDGHTRPMLAKRPRVTAPMVVSLRRVANGSYELFRGYGVRDFNLSGGLEESAITPPRQRRQRAAVPHGPISAPTEYNYEALDTASDATGHIPAHDINTATDPQTDRSHSLTPNTINIHAEDEQQPQRPHHQGRPHPANPILALYGGVERGVGFDPVLVTSALRLGINSGDGGDSSSSSSDEEDEEVSVVNFDASAVNRLGVDYLSSSIGPTMPGSDALVYGDDNAGTTSIPFIEVSDNLREDGLDDGTGGGVLSSTERPQTTDV